jgi:tRNA (guanine-N(7)-)-methyltransferase subunit TRM82
MPKRPNAIAFANNDQNLLCADKFGDVYALPLIERKDVPLKATPALLSRSATPATTKTYQSQANEKTVHSKRNKKALENQKKQAEKEGTSTPKNGINPKKDPTSDFYHKLILGHVSMLTDLAVGKVPTLDPKSGKSFHKELIITADRDEHIRVSRGMPQSHVIENFLLGHKEFVSRIHIPARYPNILISGGGDSYIYVWDYLSGQLLSKQEMRKDLVKQLDADMNGEPPLAVSGIASYYDPNIDQTRVFVICEKYVSHLLAELVFLPDTNLTRIASPKSSPSTWTTSKYSAHRQTASWSRSPSLPARSPSRATHLALPHSPPTTSKA